MSLSYHHKISPYSKAFDSYKLRLVFIFLTAQNVNQADKTSKQEHLRESH